MLRLALVVAFIVIAWAIFSQVRKTPATAESSDDQATLSDTPSPILPPSLRIVGTWRYLLNDEESKKRAEAQESLQSGADDPISQAMLNRLDRKLRDSLQVTEASLTITRAEDSESGSWEAIEEGEDNLTFVFASQSRGDLGGTATFEGPNWLALQLHGPARIENLRWQRVKPAQPAAAHP